MPTFDKKLYYILGGVVFLIIFYNLFLGAPFDFKTGDIINIPEGSNLRSVSLKLKNENIIKSRTAFEAFVILNGGEKHIIPADYLFESKESVWEVARRITKGERHLAPIAVTIPEGFDTNDMALAFAPKLPSFDKNKFLMEAKSKEGYLFPDTYFFFTTDTEVDALRLMSANFDKKILPLQIPIKASGKSESQIIIMASIVEREAKGDADRAVIAGILWKRIQIGMPLQVDAAPDTYKVVGLPKAPICNPGLEAIKAAITPQASAYLYYLHDKEGNIHYAKTFQEHILNRIKYLK